MAIGVVIVTYNAQDIIIDCLQSVVASLGVDVRPVVIDNGSTDQTVAVVESWAKQRSQSLQSNAAEEGQALAAPELIKSTDALPGVPSNAIGLIASSQNLGFAGGVNLGIRSLMVLPEIDSFWILNPDCVAEPKTASRLLEKTAKYKEYGIVGGRVFYSEPKHMIQSDGGKVNFWTGTCIPFNMTKVGRSTIPPQECELDYVSGAHMLVSRKFVERAGLMPEEYFLYYEEIDWCQRRGDLALLFTSNAAVHHIGGYTVGSAKINKRPSPIAAYFMARSRIMFVLKYRPMAVPFALLYCVQKAVRHLVHGHQQTAREVLRGTFGFGLSKDIQRIIGRSKLPTQIRS